jgi:hypothetical protein
MPPSRALDKAFDPELPAVRKAIDALEVAMGGRQSLIDTLSTADDPDVEYLLGLIADPRSDDKSLGHLCDQGNITPGQLLKLYRTARIARAQVLALDKVAERTPAVAADVMRRAENHYRICESCAGNKQVWVILRGPKGEALDTVQQDCRTCEATGQVLVAGSATGRGAEAESFLNFIRHNSPRTRESDLNCPVFIFHAADDSNIPISQSREFADRLRAMAKNVTFETVPIGDHYDSMIRSGIPKGIAWLRGLEGRKPTPKVRSTVIPNVLFPNEPQGNLPVDTPFTPPPRDSGSLPIEPSKSVAVTINGVELKPNDKLEFRRGGDNWEPVEYFGPGPANTVLILRKDLKHAMPVPIDRLRLPIRAN